MGSADQPINSGPPLDYLKKFYKVASRKNFTNPLSKSKIIWTNSCNTKIMREPTRENIAWTATYTNFQNEKHLYHQHVFENSEKKRHLNPVIIPQPIELVSTLMPPRADKSSSLDIQKST
tara:strand:+ start:322 stop:681 length:360 start_codon:yes stop_codon:yes gene_type:complete